MEQRKGAGVSRRSFVKGSTVAALATVAATGGASSLFGCAPKEKGTATAYQAGGVFANEVPEEGEVVWQSCCHCGFVACPIKCHVVDGTLRWIDNDTDGDPEFGGVSFRPVSYTHLDVYKRQLRSMEACAPLLSSIASERISKEPVSYTHLDVYKRQRIASLMVLLMNTIAMKIKSAMSAMPM